MKEKSTRKFFDEAFTEVFSNRKMVESLLRSFIGEEWVAQIDFETMSIRKSVFKGIHKVKRESDLLITFQTKKGGAFSIFLLLEFQSSAEKMITRILEYLARIYQIQTGEYNTLFPVVPIVIYNGEDKWMEPVHLSDNFSFITQDLMKYIPDFRYILINERQYSDKLLKKLKNAVAYFFLLDKTDLRKRNKGEKRIIGILMELRKHDNELFDLLGQYISGLMEYRGVETSGIYDYTYNRGKPMLAQSMDKLIEQGREEAKIEDARKMLEKGYLVEDIVEITGLSQERIDRLKKQKNKQTPDPS